MLTYEQCAALKAAGLPQTQDGAVINSKGQISYTAGVCRHITCPNSDELIAAIQARDGWNHWECLLLELIGHPCAKNAPGLAHAAAAYYIALAAEPNLDVQEALENADLT